MDNERIEANTVRYCLYPKLSDEHKESEKTQYQTYIDDCLAKLANYLTDYYWYYTPFNLNYINSESSHSKVAHIEGCTNFDENIQDEWFIVFLLIKLSTDDPDLIIEIKDSDGYFLLIEVADFLPKWVNPKTSTNRCFINKGQLNLIPIQKSAIKHASIDVCSTKLNPPTIQQALNLIRDQNCITICSVEIQNQIKRRIEDYPAKIYSSLHKCKLILPSKIAFILNKDPKLISHSIRAFYNRDHFDLAACRLMKHFPPIKLVTRVVKLSKFNYAQLLAQNYKPDPKLNWYSPTVTSSAITDKNEQIQKQYDLGFKISCGFEILLSVFKQSKSEKKEICDEKLSRQTSNSESRNWKLFLNNLEKRNYFDNLIENSNEYNERLKKAKLYFENSDLAEITSDCALIEHYQIGKFISKLLSEFDETNFYDQFKKEELNLPHEDSDDWLNELPDYLLKSEQSFDDLPSEITNCLQEFIKSDSDYKGVELESVTINNTKKRKSDLKERAFKMMSDNLRSIITMKVSDSESDHSETDLSDYNSTASSDEELNVNELKYLKQQNVNKSKKFKELNERKRRKKVESNSNKEIKQLMNDMDRELATTTIGKSFEKLSLQRNVPMASCAEFDEDYSCDEEENGDIVLNDVDVEFNAVKNLLGSFKEQNGLSGPTSNILGTIGVRALPKDLD